VGLLSTTLFTSFCAFAATQQPGGAATAAPPVAPAATAPAPAAPAPAAPAPATQKPAAVPAPSMAADVKALVDRMQAFYEKVQDFTATFKQDYTYKIARRTQSSAGKVTFKKPGMMRWEYEKPAPKTFVLAGDRAYTHDPQAMLLTKTAFDQSQLSASVTFLFGTGKLEKEFSIAKVDCAKCSGTLLELTPLKPDPRFRKVRLEVDSKTAQVLRSIVFDPDGSENAITFSGLKTNVGVSKDVFVLNAPAGTQVQDLTAPK
jgi:outer membrane lipoprotein carrier protein